jgi:biopolymer transport protein ExbD
MILLGSSIYGKKTTDQVVPPPPSTADIALRLDVKNNGFRLIVGTEKFSFPKLRNEWDATELNKRLALVRNNYKDKTDATITVDNEVPYDKLIMGMDTLLQAGFVAVSVATTEAED